jgi:acyl-CoA reductase-like NAD-dependent aldehyde dehydrogenase
MQTEVKSYWKNYINGKWIDASDGGRLTVMNPATNRPLAEVARATMRDVDAAVAAARACHDSRIFSGMRPRVRGQLLVEMGRKLRERKEEIARLLSMDAGKRISEARAEVEGSARYLEFYGGLAPAIQGKYIPTMSLLRLSVSLPTSFHGITRTTWSRVRSRRH